ncbi:MAG TPA: tol-pal system protein YbgF [Spongiibacteraceae bacterium]|nr:tol-pal system protein YbgF [Spongiibacteraceae bacterium]
MRLQITSSLATVFCFSAALASAQAPIIDAGQPVNTSRMNAAPAATPGNSTPTGDLFIQLQALQQEVMQLRGIVEDQSHQIETLKQQSLDRYNDLDQRIGGRPQPAAPAAATEAPIDANATPAAPEAQATPAAAAAPVATAAVMETPKPEEYEAYQAAYSKLRGQDFNGAIKGFNTYLQTYPNGTLVSNSYYWLGKAYLLVQPQDLKKAQQSFEKVAEFPRSNKVPDALYELGKVYFLKGDKVKAKETLQQVIDNYGASGSSAPQLAKQFLDQNFAAKH